MKVSRWGNSLAVRLPGSVVAQLGLKEGDEIEIGVRDGDAPRITIARRADPEALLARLRTLRGRLPADFRFDRDDANTRER